MAMIDLELRLKGWFKLESDRGETTIEALVGEDDVLDHFTAKQVVQHFDNEALLEEMDINIVRDWLDAQ